MKISRILIAAGWLLLTVLLGLADAQEPILGARDYPSLGTRNITFVDTSGHVPVAMTGPGANQSWVFTDALRGDTVVYQYVTPSETPFYISGFSGADWAIRTKQWLSIDAIPSFSIPQTVGFFDLCYYEKLRNDTIQGIGLGTTTPFNSGGYLFSKSSTNMVLPMKVGSGWTKSYSTQAPVKVSGINATLIAKDSSICSVDASGTLTIPMGTFECLRIKSKRFVSVKAFVLFFEVPVSTDTLIQYDWWTPKIGLVQQVVSHGGEKNEQFTNAGMVNRLYSTDRMIALLSPNGGETWQASSTQTIRWNSQKVDSVKLEYSVDQGSSWNVIQSGVPASAGQYSWTLPDVENSQNCLVRVSDKSQPGILDKSDNVFSIFKKTLALVSPNGGENWLAGSAQTIQWNSQNVASVKLDFSTDQGVNWTTIQSSLPSSPNQYAWTLPDVDSRHCLVRIGDVSQAELSDASDAVFTIFKKSLALVSPNGGENWRAQSVQTIQWTSRSVDRVKLKYSTNLGKTWSTIQLSLAASLGQYSWTLPNAASPNCLVQITDVSQTNVLDQSDNPFTIYKSMLVLVSPDGGENWQAGSAQTIQWNSQNVASVTLDFSTDQGVTWTTIQSNLSASPNQYSWTVPDSVSQQCLVRVVDASQAGLSDASDSIFSIFKRTLALISPNGGENWQAGSVQTIQWNSQNVASVTLDFSTDQGVNWKTIQPSLPASPNQYSWTVPDTISPHCLVRISDESQTGLSDASDSVFSIFKKTLTLISPNGGENWQTGSVQTIQWNAQNIAAVKLEYSLNHGGDWWTIRSSLAASPNQYTWTVPDTNSQECLIRISDESQAGLSDASDSVFSIFKKTLALISPNGGENWQAGSVQTIQWNSRNVETIKLEYSLNQGGGWTTIQSSLSASPGQYSWTVPDTVSRKSFVRVSDISQPWLSDVSDEVFSIFKKTLALVSPNGGENWLAGSVQTIQWNAQNIDAVKLEYSLDQGSDWTTIQSSLSASPGRYAWTVPDTISRQCFIRISDASQVGLLDASDHVFSIFKKTLALVSPNGGETLQAGDTVQVLWESVGIDTVHLLITYNQGAAWDTLAASIPSTGAYDWIVPNVDTKQGMIRIEYAADRSLDAQSAETFTIKPTPPSAVDGSGGIPERFGLSQNYPNPFNPITHIRFDLPKASQVRIGVYDTNGKMIRILKAERMSAGSHEIVWDGKNDTGEWIPSGVYFTRMNANGETFTRKMLFIK